MKENPQNPTIINHMKFYFAAAGIFGKPNSSTNTPSWFVATLSAPGSRSGASGAWKIKQC